MVEAWAGVQQNLNGRVVAHRGLRSLFARSFFGGGSCGLRRVFFFSFLRVTGFGVPGLFHK
ncbi:hypothetical protein AXW84_07205 [Hymenobacter sp. PAMC 26628]|nr:hypothetical protein AXW84_07205 [Hymenobacter sp. PAMC 26628]